MASPQKMGFYVSTTRANSGIFIAIDSPHISKRKLNIPAHLLSWRGGAKGCNSLLPKDLAAANFKPCSAGYALIDVVLLDNAPLSLCTMSNWLSPTPSQERRQKSKKRDNVMCSNLVRCLLEEWTSISLLLNSFSSFRIAACEARATTSVNPGVAQMLRAPVRIFSDWRNICGLDANYASLTGFRVRDKAVRDVAILLGTLWPNCHVF